MACTCPDINCTQQTINGIVYCNCPTVISNIICPIGCETVIRQDGTAFCRCTEIVEPVITNTKIKIDYNNNLYFEDVSWTVSYSLATQSWTSYHDYKPDLYFNFNNYFQTFLNYSKNNLKNGTSWSHLLTNRSYSVFYGNKYPAWIELAVMPNGANNILNSVSINAQSRRYQNNFDYSEVRNRGFTSATISNATNSSGKLKLFPELTLQDKSKYPITDLTNNEQSVSYIDLDGVKTFNYFYNRRRNDENLQPLFLNDKSQIKKTVNKKAVSFKNFGSLDRMRGQYFTVLLEDESDTRFETLLNFIDVEQKLY
jgi:GGDEF domain-containing protein